MVRNRNGALKTSLSALRTHPTTHFSMVQTRSEIEDAKKSKWLVSHLWRVMQRSTDPIEIQRRIIVFTSSVI